jgi:hypothetical protein
MSGLDKALFNLKVRRVCEWYRIPCYEIGNMNSRLALLDAAVVQLD